jgi:hypothetical protein
MAKANGGSKAPPPKEKQKPAHEVRLGRIRCTIWRNEHEKGPWYSMTLTRSYKDGDEWKSASSFGTGDLLVLGEVARMAFHWIHRQYQQKNGGGQPEEAQDASTPEADLEIPF